MLRKILLWLWTVCVIVFAATFAPPMRDLPGVESARVFLAALAAASFLLLGLRYRRLHTPSR